MASTKLSALTELAAKPAADDELYIRDVSEIAADESKRITIANLLTKEFFTPATGTSTGVASASTGRYAAVLLNASGEDAYTTFTIPDDFNAMVEAVVIVAPAATQAAANWDIYSTYNAIGEDDSGTLESDLASTYNVTNDELFEVDISGVLSALAKGDVVGIFFRQSTAGHNVDVLGVRFKYN